MESIQEVRKSNYMNESYDYSVSFTRVCAMLFIMICHLGSHFNLTAVGQFFNVGVPIFFLISGYLYGKKEIKDVKKWLIQRTVRIYIPLLVWGAIVTIAMAVKESQLPSVIEYIFFLLNLHGLNFILYRMNDLAMGPWFFTVIMVCYLMTAAYFVARQHIKNLDKVLFSFGGIIPFIIFVVFVYLGINLNGPLCYMIGFGLKKREILEKKRPKNIFVAFIIFVIAVGVRLLSKHYIDGSILYNQILAPITHIMIAAAFFIGIRWLFEMFPGVFTKIAANRGVRWIDTISIYVYICHDWFISDLFVDIFELVPSFVLGLILFFICGIITASGLYWIGKNVTDGLNKVMAR